MAEIVYSLDKAIDIGEWLRLYRACAWNQMWTSHNAQVMLAHAYLIVTAWRDGELVGTLTLLSDGVNYATIDDVVVHPEHRGQGIGRQLVRLAVEQAGHLEPHLEAVPGSTAFYERSGFVVNRGHTGMYWPRSATDDPPTPEANSLSST